MGSLLLAVDMVAAEALRPPVVPAAVVVAALDLERLLMDRLAVLVVVVVLAGQGLAAQQYHNALAAVVVVPQQPGLQQLPRRVAMVALVLGIHFRLLQLQPMVVVVVALRQPFPELPLATLAVLTVLLEHLQQEQTDVVVAPAAA
jgi:hypothetical protein